MGLEPTQASMLRKSCVGKMGLSNVKTTRKAALERPNCMKNAHNCHTDTPHAYLLTRLKPLHATAPTSRKPQRMPHEYRLPAYTSGGREPSQTTSS
jgi:hypothetical protein